MVRMKLEEILRARFDHFAVPRPKRTNNTDYRRFNQHFQLQGTQVRTMEEEGTTRQKRAKRRNGLN